MLGLETKCLFALWRTTRAPGNAIGKTLECGFERMIVNCIKIMI